MTILTVLHHKHIAVDKYVMPCSCKKQSIVYNKCCFLIYVLALAAALMAAGAAMQSRHSSCDQAVFSSGLAGQTSSPLSESMVGLGALGG